MATLGENLLKLLDARRYGTINRLAGEIDVTPSTLYRWVKHANPRIPAEVFDAIARALEMDAADLVRELSKKEGPDVVKEHSPEYRGKDESRESAERWAQPLDDRTIAVQALGRLEHYAARIREVGDEYRTRVDELARMAEDEIALARKSLMRKIGHNDKGEKV